jgi:hypothetical protein
MGSIFKLENASGKEYLNLNTEHFRSDSKNDTSETGGSGGFFVGSFNLGGSAKLVQQKSSEWKEAGKSITEQVLIFLFFCKEIFLSNIFKSYKSHQHTYFFCE